MRLSSNLLYITLMLLIGSVSPDCWTIWINTSQNPITRPCSTVTSGPVISLQDQTGEHVDDAGGIHVAWSNGSSLAAIHGIDVIRRID